MLVHSLWTVTHSTDCSWVFGSKGQLLLRDWGVRGGLFLALPYEHSVWQYFKRVLSTELPLAPGAYAGTVRESQWVTRDQGS